uniref:Uncharacterized protein n=1 Tax=Arundo donax TaxID=35708 RepID=A0A0A8YU98_ARUDO
MNLSFDGDLHRGGVQTCFCVLICSKLMHQNVRRTKSYSHFLSLHQLDIANHNCALLLIIPHCNQFAPIVRRLEVVLSMDY